jgi:hypothetical protein
MSTKKQTWANAHSQLWTSPAPRTGGSRTQSEASSIASPNRDRSLLDDTDLCDRPGELSALSHSQLHYTRPKEKTLVQITDILESYGVISKEADIPAVLLNVVKELEEAKRENNFKDLLLREYGDTVRRRFCLYGEDAPPSVAELSRRLRDGNATTPTAGPAPVWLEEPLNHLRSLLEKESQSCFGEQLDFSLPLLLPNAAHTKTSVLQVLQKCQEMLARMSSEYKDAKRSILDKLGKAASSKDKQMSLSLTEALAELESRQLLESNGATRSDTQEAERGHSFEAALESVINTIPASLQIHFELQRHDAPVLSQCSNLQRLLRFLLSEYLSTERYMEEVEKQRRKLALVFRLPSTEPNEDTTDDKTQIDDALTHSLELLKRTVTAVVTFPHQISEEEIGLRHASKEAVEELAQLLVESRPSSSSVGAVSTSPVVRIEPPTENLLEMVEMVKSRFASLLMQQQRKELVGAQSRIGFAHMEEAMRSQGKLVLQQLRDMCAVQDENTGAEQSETLSELMGGLDMERNLSPAKLDYFLSDIGERLRMVKAKYHRALNAAATNKTRADAAAQKCTAAQKKLHKIVVSVERLGVEGLGLTFPLQLGSSNSTDTDESAGRGGTVVESESGRGDGTSALRRLNLRPTSDSTKQKATVAASSSTAVTATGTGTITESNVLEALQYLYTRVCADDALRDQLKLREEVEQLRSSQARWKADTSAFREAMAMLMHRLASNGQLVKQSLFMMGTDESAKDDLVEEVLQRGEGKAGNEEAEAEYVERSLAELLQKYTRWAQRLQQTTEDHLYTQRKIVKYFAAVRRFFASQQRTDAAAPEDIPDDNLYDIDSCLMRAADVILPVLDAAIQDVERHRDTRSSAVASSPPPPPLSHSASPPDAGVATTEGQAAQRQDAIVQLVRDSAAATMGGVLPYDHRIARLYETVTRLYTAVTSLLQVHYLCIPTGAKQRSTGDVELLFDGNADGNGFVDIDLDRLIRVSQRRTAGGCSSDADEEGRFTREGASDVSHRGGGGAASPPPSTVAANNDVILRVTYQNMEVLQDMLKRFSANHKMAAIVLQKDMDAMQQQLASMLEKYSEVDMETAFHQSREELHDLYVTLRDRAQVQKGCYFFNRVGGEGSCTWVTALEQLGDGFRGVVDRLVQRTAQAAEYRELTDEVVDMCAMYINWAEHQPLPSSQTLAPELLAMCLRDGDGVGAEGVAAGAAPAVSVTGSGDSDAAQTPPSSPPPPAGMAKAAQRPPKPSGTPALTPRDSIKKQQEGSEGEGGHNHDAVKEAKVSAFTDNRAVLKVMEHMFQLAQRAAEQANVPLASTAATAAAAQEAEARSHQLAEELSLLREAVAVAERHVDELTESKQTVERQRDQAQSEAAVARAELRRWKRQQQQRQQQREEGAAAQASPQGLLDVNKGHAASAGSNRRAAQPSSAFDADAGDALREATTPPVPVGGNVGMDEATVREVMAYMKLLSEELQTARQRAGIAATMTEAQPSQWRQRLPQAEGEAEDEERGDELVRSPYPAKFDDAQKEASAHPSFPTPLPNRYTALAEELRHRYGSSSLSPMVVVDPHTRYSGATHRTPTTASPPQQQQRYTPVKFHGPAYDACDRYYTRELAEGEGERRAEQLQRRGVHDGGLRAAASPPSTSLSLRTATPQRRVPRCDSRELGEAHCDTHFGNSISRRVAGRQPLPATPGRYPRSLIRDEPFRVPTAGVDTPGSHVYQAPQRATPVTSSAHALATAGASRTRQRYAAPPIDTDDFPARCSIKEENVEGEEEEYYDEARWRVPSQMHHQQCQSQHRHRAPTTTTTVTSSSATRRRSASTHAAAAPSPGASSTALSPSGRHGDDEHDLSANLTEAVQQIEAATQRGSGQRLTPSRRTGSHPRRPHDVVSAAPSPEQQISRNANLRSAALRRLAEVVSRTSVTPRRGARF